MCCHSFRTCTWIPGRHHPGVRYEGRGQHGERGGRAQGSGGKLGEQQRGLREHWAGHGERVWRGEADRGTEGGPGGQGPITWSVITDMKGARGQQSAQGGQAGGGGAQAGRRECWCRPEIFWDWNLCDSLWSCHLTGGADGEGLRALWSLKQVLSPRIDSTPKFNFCFVVVLLIGEYLSRSYIQRRCEEWLMSHDY